MRTIHLDVEGMRCRRCVREATALLRDIPGIATLTADPRTSRIMITGDVTEVAILRALAGTTFTVQVTSTPPHSAPGSDPSAAESVGRQLGAEVGHDPGRSNA